MTIGIDGNEANVEKRVGVSWYCFYLLQQFSQSHKHEFRVFLRQPPVFDMPKSNAHFKYVVVKGRKLWSQIFLPLSLFLHHRDLSVFFSPAHYAPRFCPSPTVVTIHDLSFFYYPNEFLKKDLYQLQKWTEYSVKNARSVIAVSQTTANDIQELYNISKKNINVIHNGFTSHSIRDGELSPEIKSPYFLYIGTLQPRKNLTNVVLAFEKFVQKNSIYTLYLIGKKGWLYKEFMDLIEKRKLQNQVVLLDYVSNNDRSYLLKKSVALIVPGLYEGFGLPILEGFDASVPVIASNSGALPEVGGDACVYFDPLNVQQLSDSMQKISVDKKLKEDLVKKGKNRLKLFSWKKTAEGVLSVLESI